MTDQPPVQPPHQPPGHPAEGNPATQPMPAAENPSPAVVDPSAAGANPSTAAGNPSPDTPPPVPRKGVWHQATSTHGGRWAIGIAAAALALLMFLGIGVAGLLVLRNHDRFAMMGQRQDRFSRGQLGQGNGRGPGGESGRQGGMPGAPGMRGGGPQGLGGLGGLLGGGALHGNVTATVNGSVQALVFQRGEVTAVSATSIALKSSDGFVGTYGRTSETGSMMGAPVTGGQAFVLARASDKVALTLMSTSGNTGVGPSN
jgi:hypothetical protein